MEASVVNQVYSEESVNTLGSYYHLENDYISANCR